MALYTRAQYEEDCQRIDKQMAISADLLGDQLIGPLEHWQRCQTLEECKRKLGQKLAMSAISIADKKRTARHPAFAWVIGAAKQHEKACAITQKKGFYCNCDGAWYLKRDKPVLRHVKITNGQWRDTTLREIHELQNRGITVMESIPMRRLRSDNTPEKLEGTEFLPWEEVTREVALQREQEGHIVVKDGKNMWYAHWMVRREGEPDAQGNGIRYYITRVE